MVFCSDAVFLLTEVLSFFFWVGGWRPRWRDEVPLFAFAKLPPFLSAGVRFTEEDSLFVRFVPINGVLLFLPPLRWLARRPVEKDHLFVLPFFDPSFVRVDRKKWCSGVYSILLFLPCFLILPSRDPLFPPPP